MRYVFCYDIEKRTLLWSQEQAEQEEQNATSHISFPRWHFRIDGVAADRAESSSVEGVVVWNHHVQLIWSTRHRGPGHVAWICIASLIGEHSEEDGRKSIGSWTCLDLANDWVSGPYGGVAHNDIDESVIGQGHIVEINEIRPNSIGDCASNGIGTRKACSGNCARE